MGLLGDFSVAPRSFDRLDEVVKAFCQEAFLQQNIQQKTERVSRALYELIEREKTPCFLLPAVLAFIAEINRLKIIEGYAVYHFELWLNQFSGLSREENEHIRAKIVGKRVPREAYQELFPIGMGKRYAGSHYVTGHSSPDLDTTVASFWGWMDAFAARIGEGVHIWNLPGGPPSSQVEIGLLFEAFFGKAVFEHLPKTRTSLSLSGIDLLSQQGVSRKPIHVSSLNIEHELHEQAVLLLDEKGRYLGDWRSDDVDMVRQVINWLNGCLRWMENRLHVKLVTLFAQKELVRASLVAFVDEILNGTLNQSEPAQDFSEKQKRCLDDYVVKVLGLNKGMSSSFKEFCLGMHALGLGDFAEFVNLIEGIGGSALFNGKGLLQENRTAIFELLEKIICSLDRAIYSMRQYVEKLSVAFQIKKEVFGVSVQHVSYRADVEEIRSKIDNLSYITVTAPDMDGQIPLGVIYANDLHKSTLGTVTLRDFCNRDETKIPPYFEIISVIDHHKTALQTFSAPMVIVSDAQSSNVLCAEKAFTINDAYGLGGLSLKGVHSQIEEIHASKLSKGQRRIFRRLLQRVTVGEEATEFFIDPTREYMEYLHFLYAILDDTDLLTKMTFRDVECVTSLINRMKSLSVQKEVESINLDDLPRDRLFIAKASERILNNPDMRSLYRKIYEQKEALVNRNCLAAVRGEETTLFDDTKEQNGCNRVGQTKIFNGNYPTFAEHRQALCQLWHQHALLFYKERPEIDLHMHMISTVAGGDESQPVSHLDELWIWIPFTEQSVEHLKSFLNAFRRLPQWAQHEPILEVSGSTGTEYARLFEESFVPIVSETSKQSEILPIAVLKYSAGLLNSRKAMISPYLPRL